MNIDTNEGDASFLINILSANPTKWSNTLKQFVGICLLNVEKNEPAARTFPKTSCFVKLK